MRQRAYCRVVDAINDAVHTCGAASTKLLSESLPRKVRRNVRTFLCDYVSRTRMKQKQTTQTSIRLERTVLIAPRTRSFRERECNSPWEGGSTPPLALLANLLC